MSAYAILGATGSTGHSILKLLGPSPDKDIHVLVRSRAKLEQMYPSLSERKNIKVFEGSISDHDVLAQCLAGMKAAFLTVAVKHNEPGCSIARDTSLVVLSSASLDDKFWKDIPEIFHNTMYCAAYYIYKDLRRAEAYLREQES